jgi:hypothetical protein
LLSHTLNTEDLTKERFYAVLNNNNIVVDVWAAKSLKEAQDDNVNYSVVELNDTNSPVFLNTKFGYIGNIAGSITEESN